MIRRAIGFRSQLKSLPVTFTTSQNLLSWSSAFKDSLNYYQLLGVSRRATSDEIRDAFLNKSKMVHPDHNQSTDAQEQFKRLNEAYTTLKTPSLRREYDANLQDEQEVIKNRYFKDGDLIYDRVSGIVKRDDGSQKYTQGRAPMHKLDPKEARKKHVKFLTGLVIFAFVYAFSNMAYIATRKSSNTRISH
ncbi:chaperone protein DnaJ 1-like isoform X3 [Convolutriloba macropyga]|uniref:chaperone protein DnaJ 1-like isoform X3 n=1 Tax=Convolutriloba macropyga TaxID=536237 RepID=UPI003F52653A